MAKARTVPCVLYIPVNYPDRTRVPEELRNKFFDVFDQRFGGATEVGERIGHWQGITEPMLCVEIWVPKGQVAEFERIAVWIGKETKQKAVGFVVNHGAEARVLTLDYGDDEQSGSIASGGK